MKAAAKPKPPPPPAAAQPSTKAASSSSSSAADPNSKRALPTAADAANSTPSHPNINPNGPPNPSPLLPSPHLQPPQPLPPSRPLLTVAAVDAAMSAIGPPPQYGLECLDRRTVALSDGTVRTYFALPLEPPPQLRQPQLPPIFPAPHLGTPGPGPGPGLNRWIPPLMHAAAPPGPPPKRKWEGQSNGGAPGKSSGRQQQQQHQQQKTEERRVAKQVKVETPGIDAKTLKTSFLKMVRMINENTEVKKNYEAKGKIAPLKCAVCNRDSVDLHALLNHSYNTKMAELRADHLGLHKAICVLMGWNYTVDPVHKKAYETLSSADAKANQEDLILWPPTIIVENTYKSRNDGQKDGMSNKEMEGKLREMGFVGVSVKPLAGKDGAMVLPPARFTCRGPFRSQTYEKTLSVRNFPVPAHKSKSQSLSHAAPSSVLPRPSAAVRCCFDSGSDPWRRGSPRPPPRGSPGSSRARAHRRGLIYSGRPPALQPSATCCGRPPALSPPATFCGLPPVLPPPSTSWGRPRALPPPATCCSPLARHRTGFSTRSRCLCL